jgi:MoaA/NifB/PqqE/SkfB family radical SAM enzyme
MSYLEAEMTFHSFLGKIRKKAFRILLGKEFYDKFISSPPPPINFAGLNEYLLDIYAKTIPYPVLPRIEFAVACHCNLNCRGCAHYAPVAEKEFMDINVFNQDIKRLSVLSNGNIDTIHLCGGEPLLHPDVINFMKIAREHFARSKIRLITNGILLKTMPDNFWEAGAGYKIIISPTKYPANISYNTFEEKAKKIGVAYEYFGGQNGDFKLYKNPLSVNGSALDSVKNFLRCFFANRCTQIYNGRLYPCGMAAYSGLLNKKFNMELELKEEDSLDIYKVTDMRQILDFLARPIPFCRYCNVPGRTYGHKWGVSTQEISEWV